MTSSTGCFLLHVSNNNPFAVTGALDHFFGYFCRYTESQKDLRKIKLFSVLNELLPDFKMNM